ncbi:MAG: hypothetical protein HPY69_19760 [Armatimonadetes bacterium]|nr:hypothetical protein [Armatimonadota bacterium]
MTDRSSPIPRPEHPRPDLHRGLQEGDGWLNLNGPWDFAFDDAAVGETDGWQLPGSTAYDRCIRVPFCWESHAAWGTDDLAGNDNWYSPEAYLHPAEVSRDNYREAPRHTVGWYRRTVTCPATKADESVWLHIGAADWHVKVWANGQLVGEGDSGYVPISCDLGDAAQPGEDLTLVIRVEDPQGTEDKPLGKQHKWYTTTSGIWQTVWLEVRPLRHIRSLRLIPQLDPAAVVCEAALSPGAAPAGLRVTVTDEEGVCAGVAESSDASRPLTVPLGPSVRRWCPQDPHLYAVAVELRDGERVLDTVCSYFGLREVGVAPLYEGGPRYVTLNGPGSRGSQVRSRRERFEEADHANRTIPSAGQPAAPRPAPVPRRGRRFARAKGRARCGARHRRTASRRSRWSASVFRGPGPAPRSGPHWPCSLPAPDELECGGSA